MLLVPASALLALALQSEAAVTRQTRVREISMRGHIRRRGKTSFEYIVDIGTASAQRCQGCGRRFWVERKPRESCPKCGGELAETEERRRAIKGGFATRKECQAALNKVLTAVEARTFAPPTRITVKAFLLERVAAGHQGHAATDDLRKLHHARHASTSSPASAACSCRSSTPAAINALYAHLLEEGRVHGEAVPLSHPRCAECTPSCTAPVTMPCAGAGSRSTRSMPPIPPRPVPSTPRGCRSGRPSSSRPSLASVADDRLFALWRLLAMTGMRRGEALGLAWE